MEVSFRVGVYNLQLEPLPADDLVTKPQHLKDIYGANHGNDDLSLFDLLDNLHKLKVYTLLLNSIALLQICLRTASDSGGAILQHSFQGKKCTLINDVTGTLEHPRNIGLEARLARWLILTASVSCLLAEKHERH